MYELKIEQYKQLEEILSCIDSLNLTGMNNFTLATTAGVKLQYLLQELKKQEIIIDNTKKEDKK